MNLGGSSWQSRRFLWSGSASDEASQLPAEADPSTVPVPHEFEDGNADATPVSTTFVDAGCTSNVLAAGDWFVVGLANYRQEGLDSDGFAPEVEARLGTTRIALGGWRVLFGDLNPGDANGAFMATGGIFTANGSDALNFRIRADGGNGTTEVVRFGGASWQAFALAPFVVNVDYWVAQAANSDSAEVTAVGSTWVEGSTSGQLTIAPTVSGDYLIAAFAEGFCQVDTPAAQETARFRLRMSTAGGAAVTIGNEQESQQDLQGTDSTQFQVPMAQWDVRHLDGGVSYEIFWEFSNDSGGSQMGYRRSRVIVFRLAAFVNYSFVTYYNGFSASSGTVESTSFLNYDFGDVDVAHFASCSYQNAGSFGEGRFRHDGSPDVDYPSIGRMYVPNNFSDPIVVTNDIPLLAFDALITVSGSQTWRLAGTADTAPILTFGRNQGNSADTRSVIVALQMDAFGEAAPQVVTPASASWLWTAQTPTVAAGSVSVTPASASWLWTAQTPTAAAGAVVVTPASASWLWTGQTPTATAGAVVVTPASASWIWTAGDPSVVAATSVVPASASWLWSANDPSVSAGAVVVTPSDASWLWSANDPAVSVGTLVSPPAASWLWAANDPSVGAGAVSVVPASGSWLWSANDPIVAAPIDISPPSASWIWSANNPSVSAGDLIVTPGTASWLWSGNDPSADAGNVDVTPGSASWLWTANDPSVSAGDVVVTPAASSWLWTANDPGVDAGALVVTPGAASWLWTANDPSADAGTIDVTPTAASWLWTANDPSVSAGDILVTPGAASWVWTANDPSVSVELSVTPPSASWTWTANDPSVDAGALVVTPGAASWLWTANDPAVSAGGFVSPPPADWLWSANDPSVSAGALVVTPGTSSWLWSANDPAADAGPLVVTPGSATWTWTANDPSVDVDVSVLLDSASWLWTGQIPTVTTSGSQTITPPSGPCFWSANVPTVIAPAPPPPVPPVPPIPPTPRRRTGTGGGGGMSAYLRMIAWAQMQTALRELAMRRAQQQPVDETPEDPPVEATPSEDAAFKLAETMTSGDLRRLAIRLASRTRGVK